MPTTVATPNDIKKLQDQIEALKSANVEKDANTVDLLRRLNLLEAAVLALQTPCDCTEPVDPGPVDPDPVDPDPVDPEPEPGPGLDGLERIPWEGGPAYWNKFPLAKAAGWADPSFFPLSVFFGKPAHAQALKDVGVNLYISAEHDGSSIKDMTGKGMFVMPNGEWSDAELQADPLVIANLISDEPDMGLDVGGANTHESLAEQDRRISVARAKNDGRFQYSNFAKGVFGTFWASGTMAQFIGGVDASSVDAYAYTSPHVRSEIIRSSYWPVGVNPQCAAAYGWLVDRMRSYQSSPGIQPNWMTVETARPYLTEAGSETITIEKMESAIWSSLIHEARGIMYFQHNNGPEFGNYSMVDCPADRRTEYARINADIKSWAPVLNTQSYVWNFGAGIDSMLKSHGGSTYIFAMVKLGSTPGAKVFALPAGLTVASVEVVGESRTLPVSGGKFTDTFANEGTKHIYKLS